MLIKMLTKVFGSRNDRTLRRMRKVVNIINGMEPAMEKLSDDERLDRSCADVLYLYRFTPGLPRVQCLAKSNPHGGRRVADGRHLSRRHGAQDT